MRKSVLVSLGLAVILGWFCLGATKALPPLKSDGASSPETLTFVGLNSADSATVDGMTLRSTAAFGYRPIYDVSNRVSSSRVWYTPTDSTEAEASVSYTITGKYVGVVIYDQSAVVQIWGWEGDL